VSDRHRHDEFIWALIFSLIINLFFVFALLAQRSVEKSPNHQPFVVAITASQRALPGDSPATPRPKAIPAPTKRKKTAEPLTTTPEQRPDIDLNLPTQNNTEGATISPARAMASEMTGAEIDLSSLAATGESATATIDKETADGLSIFGDKTTGDHYTAPEYLGGEKPPYPKRAERNGWEGTVLLSLSINANGAVEKVGIAKTSGYELLDHQARKSVSAWRFKPARRNGMAIAVTVQQPIVFRSSPPEKVR
jgi:protein TonB